MALETTNQPRIKRIGLIFLSFWVALLVGSTLYGSWAEPQAQGQIGLYQTNLTLEALEWQPQLEQQETLKTQLFGKEPLQEALKQYKKVRTSLLKAHPNLLLDSESSPSDSESSPNHTAPPNDLRLRETLDWLDLNLGVLAASTENLEDATHFWQEIQSAPFTSSTHRQNIVAAQILESVWRSQSPHNDNAASILDHQLSGWFQTQSLKQLFTQTSETQNLDHLNQTIQIQAESALTRLAFAVGLPLLGSFAGVVLLIVWGIQTLRQTLNNAEAANLANTQPSSPLGIDVPWNFETFWLTMLLWFFAFFGVSLIIPLSLQLVFGSTLLSSARGQALLALSNYSGLIVAGLALIVFMTRPYIANFFQWLPIHLRGPWIRWGVGGYIAALPAVLLISVLNQKLLGEQGGGNPLLEIILQTHDIGTWFILLLMVSVLAPLFEETVFRGFALTSLTRFVPLWAAIAGSAILFATAHLNIADFLPLFVLGCILGTVYSQSRNLLASILLHSLWNGAQLIELLYLSGN